MSIRSTHRVRLFVSLVCISALVCSVSVVVAQPTDFDPAKYPPARVGDTVETLHGVKVADPYRWLEDEESEETQAWVKAENALTQETLGRFTDVQAEIAKELEAVYGVDAVSGLQPFGRRYFFMKREGLENHSKLFVREGNHRGTPKLVLDPNTFSEDGTVALDWYYPSPDGRYVAYGKSASGSEKSTLYVRELKTGKDLPDVIPFTQYCNIAWNRSATGFYYNRCPDPKTIPAGEENFHMRVYFHRLGNDYKDDQYVWGEGRPIDEEPRCYPSSDHEFVLLNFFRDPSVNDLYYGQIGSERPLMPIAAGLGAITTGDVIERRVILRTNYKAPKFRICVTTTENPGPESWQDIVPEGKGVIDGFKVIDRHLIVHVTEDVHSRLLVYTLAGTLVEEIELPGIGTVTDLAGAYDRSELFFSFSSWVTPTTNYRYDLETKKLEVLSQRACPVDLSPYTTKQVWCTSKDGTKVPMFIVARKDIKLDGQNPTLLYGYGGFNSSFYPAFRPRIIPFLKRGGVWVLANIRGGGELGQAWHDGGRRENKQNCFNDFYAAGEELIRLGYTNPKKLACKGGSNGGLLIGAAVSQRPDLFQAALSQVPLMDMLRFHHWGMGAQWVHEYGDPEKADEFKWVYAYSPYHNVKKGTDYPATLVVTAEADNRVDTAHAFKMVAAMQAATSGKRPILLRCESKAGHGAGKPLSMRIANQSEDWAFLMWQLGMLP